MNKVISVISLTSLVLLGGCGQNPQPSNITTIHHENKYVNLCDIEDELISELEKEYYRQEALKPKYRTEEAIITYYTATDDECGKDDGITASGTVATEGRTVASDHLPLGTVVEIDGVQYVVEDRFGGGYNNKIDVFVNDKHTAYKKRKRKVKVKIYE